MADGPARVERNITDAFGAQRVHPAAHLGRQSSSHIAITKLGDQIAGNQRPWRQGGCD